MFVKTGLLLLVSVLSSTEWLVKVNAIPVRGTVQADKLVIPGTLQHNNPNPLIYRRGKSILPVSSLEKTKKGSQSVAKPELDDTGEAARHVAFGFLTSKELHSYKSVSKAWNKSAGQVISVKNRLEGNDYNSKKALFKQMNTAELKSFVNQGFLDLNQRMWILEFVLRGEKLDQDWMDIIQSKFKLLPEMHHICIQVIRDQHSSIEQRQRAMSFMKFLCGKRVALDGVDCHQMAASADGGEKMMKHLQHVDIKSTKMLMGMVQHDEIDALKMLLRNPQSDLDPNWIDPSITYPSHARSAFSKAVILGYTAIVELLLKVPGINVNQASVHGKTALAEASLYGHTDIVKLLLSVPGIDVNDASDNGYTALMWASYSGHSHTDIVKLLLNVPGIDVNHENNHGITALIDATNRDKVDVVQLLLKVPGINVNHADSLGHTALMQASATGRVAIVKSLLKVPGIDVNHVDRLGYTALINASKSGVTDAVRLLLEAPDMNKNIANIYGDTALIEASQNGHGDIVKLLSEASPIKSNQVNK